MRDYGFDDFTTLNVERAIRRISGKNSVIRYADLNEVDKSEITCVLSGAAARVRKVDQYY